MSVNVVKDGKLKKVAGAEGVTITSIEQTGTSSVSGGTNTITCTLSDGSTQTFIITNGTSVLPLGRPETTVAGMIWIEQT